jgi:hypothetical protein
MKYYEKLCNIKENNGKFYIYRKYISIYITGDWIIFPI